MNKPGKLHTIITIVRNTAIIFLAVVIELVIIYFSMPEVDPVIVGPHPNALSYDVIDVAPRIVPSHDSFVVRAYTDLIDVIPSTDRLPHVSMMRVPARRDADVINAHALRYQEQLFIEEELTCLATNLYHEARGDGIIGMAAVAWVTINRQHSEQFPDTICGVVYDPNQFSWVYEGQYTSGNNDVYRSAHKVATRIYEGQYILHDFTLGSLYFHSGPASAVSWARRFDMVFEYDGHKFYQDNR